MIDLPSSTESGCQNEIISSRHPSGPFKTNFTYMFRGNKIRLLVFHHFGQDQLRIRLDQGVIAPRDDAGNPTFCNIVGFGVPQKVEFFATPKIGDVIRYQQEGRTFYIQESSSKKYRFYYQAPIVLEPQVPEDEGRVIPHRKIFVPVITDKKRVLDYILLSTFGY